MPAARLPGAKSVGLTSARGANGDAMMRDIGLSFGAAHAVIGGVGLGMTLWEGRAPEKRVMLVPASMRDAAGHLTPGIGIAGVGF